MGANQTKSLRIASAIVIVVAVALSYNNCSQQDWGGNPNDQSPVQLQESLSQTISKQDAADLCATPESFRCVHNVFAPDIEETEHDAKYDCVNVSGKEFCLKGRRYLNNTKYAISQCEGCSESEIQRRYNYDEYTCYNTYTYKGEMPIKATASTLDQAVKLAYDVCQKVAGDRQ